MSELPFSTEEFLQVFVEYNQAIWPAQFLAYLLGISALAFVIKKSASSNVVNYTLALFWLWMGIVYHMLFFSEINPLAYLFGALFVLQGVAFLLLPYLNVEFRYTLRTGLYGVTGVVLLLYAMVVYPMLGHYLGHTYPMAPTFGVAPCPTVIFTFGLLLLTEGRIPAWLLVIPGLWAIMGFSAALQLTMHEDIGLVVAGVVSIGLLLYRNYNRRSNYRWS